MVDSLIANQIMASGPEAGALSRAKRHRIVTLFERTDPLGERQKTIGDIFVTPCTDAKH